MNTKPNFKLTQLNLIHYHLDSSDITAGEPIKTSIELKSDYDYENEALYWTRTISHTYYALESLEKKTDTYTERLENIDSLIQYLEQNDLRELKNNYFTEEGIESYSHWEVIYNNYFHIVGTYDQVPELISNLNSLLEFKKIIKNEIKKVLNNKIESQV